MKYGKVLNAKSRNVRHMYVLSISSVRIITREATCALPLTFALRMHVFAADQQAEEASKKERERESTPAKIAATGISQRVGAR